MILAQVIDTARIVSQYAAMLQDKNEHQQALIYVLCGAFTIIGSLIVLIWTSTTKHWKEQFGVVTTSMNTQSEAINKLVTTLSVNYKEEEAHRGYCSEKHQLHKVEIESIKEDIDGIDKRVTRIVTQHGMNHPSNPILTGD